MEAIVMTEQVLDLVDGPDDPENGTAEAAEQGREETSELDSLRAQLAASEAEVSRRADAEHAMLQRLREALVVAEPAIAPDLLTGTTLAEVESSYAAALAMVQRVREAAVRQNAAAVPAGAPGRVGAAQPLTAFEKIRVGIARLG
jgi:hypothetical protein